MRRSLLLATIALIGSATVAAVPKPDTAIEKAVADPTRPADERARDQYRHPVQTLAFFGVKPGQKIVEFSPSAGWYTAILGPVTGPRGSYTALVTSPRGAEAATKMLTDRGVKGSVATMDPAAGTSTVAPGSQDVVLTFRNVHNLVMAPNAAVPGNAFKTWFAMLKPGGVLGVVDHRLPESRDTAEEKKTGYLKTLDYCRVGNRRRVQARRRKRGQRQREGYRRSPGGCLDVAARVPPQGHRPREICRDRRERPHDAEVREAQIADLSG